MPGPQAAAQAPAQGQPVIVIAAPRPPHSDGFVYHTLELSKRDEFFEGPVGYPVLIGFRRDPAPGHLLIKVNSLIGPVTYKVPNDKLMGYSETTDEYTLHLYVPLKHDDPTTNNHLQLTISKDSPLDIIAMKATLGNLGIYDKEADRQQLKDAAAVLGLSTNQK